ncbi:sulfatase [Neolewinella agarilytica]|uniref:Arylsulfatase A n=1 Tax=Neolewinella agarilytica TaxID=478744 RepID=A0A1H9NRX2_9BACT|nr:sulfatase [Neolewinella agarilytica]SER38784.1 Arylsulfatase A [Neolewinella agarilytica]
MSTFRLLPLPCLLLLLTACAPEPDLPPNVLFIIADDLGYHDLGVTGSDYYETPHLDALAKGGMQFTNAYTASRVCSPARASIMTGQFTARHGITDWIGAKTGEDWRKVGRHNQLLPPDYHHNMDTSHYTMAEAFAAAGYETFFAGKWHIGGEQSRPEDHGFAINKGGYSSGSPRGGYFSPWDNPVLPNEEAGENLSMRLSRETADFINQRDGSAPFFAMLSFYAVHGPIQTTEEKWAKYQAKAVEHGLAEHGFGMERRLPIRLQQDNPVYAGLVEQMDDAVGLVMAALEEAGIADNTIVVFTSDHGGVASGDAYATSNAPLRGGKGYQWEGGLRVPLLLRFPTRVDPGQKSSVPISGADLYPSLLSLAGQSPADRQPMDGMDMVQAVERGISPRRSLYWHYPHYGNQGGDPSSIILRDNYKLIHYHETGKDELYDLYKDPRERLSVTEQQPKVSQELKTELMEYLNSVGARFPDRDPLYDPVKAAGVAAFRRDTLLPRLERQRKEMLSEGYEPNEDWWGSRQ